MDAEEPVGLVESDHIGEEVRVAPLQLAGTLEQFLGTAFSFNFRNSALISLIFDDLIKILGEALFYWFTFALGALRKITIG